MSNYVVHEQFASAAQQRHAYTLATWAFIASEALLFAALFACYGAYRAMYGADFVEAIGHANLLSGTIDTYVLVTSSFTCTLAVIATQRDRLLAARLLLLATIALGATFLGLEMTEWADDFHQGILPGQYYAYAALPSFGAKMYFTAFFFMTGLHALHVLGGSLALSVILIRHLQGAYDHERYVPVVCVAMFWHFVDVVWAFLWSCLYLAR